MVCCIARVPAGISNSRDSQSESGTSPSFLLHDLPLIDRTA